VSSEPADGSVLALPPKMVQLHFNESVAPAVIGVIDAAGKTRDVATRAVGQSVLIVLPDDLPQGTQIVSYRVVSQDGHPVAGSLVFLDRRRDRGRAAGEANPLAVLIWLARIGVYLGLFVGVGGAFFAAWIGQGSSGSTVSRGALAVGLVSAVASLGLQGLDLLNLPLAASSRRALGERARDLPRAVAIDCDRRDGHRLVRVEKPEHPDCLGVDHLAMAGVGLSLARAGMPRPPRRNG
jgi:copper transport protein